MRFISKLKRLVAARSGLLLNVLLFSVVFVGVSAFQARNMLSASGASAPVLSGPLLAGGSYDIASAAGKPVLVYFFAPWCRICAASSGNLTRLRRWRDEDSLEIVAVALDWEDPGQVREYIERHPLDLPVVLGAPTTARDWRIAAFPTYYVLDSQHRVRRRDLGYSTQFGLWWRTWFVG